MERDDSSLPSLYSNHRSDIIFTKVGEIGGNGIFLHLVKLNIKGVFARLGIVGMKHYIINVSKQK